MYSIKILLVLSIIVEKYISNGNFLPNRSSSDIEQNDIPPLPPPYTKNDEKNNI